MSGITVDLDAVLERMNTVERHNRRLKQTGLAVFLIIGTCALLGLGVPKARTVEAEKFVVRDKQGKERAVLGLETDGTVGLWLQNKEEGMRVALDLFPEGSSDLSLHDRDGNVRAWLRVLEDGSAELSMNRKSGKPSVVIHMSQSGEATLDFFDADPTKVLWQAP